MSELMAEYINPDSSPALAPVDALPIRFRESKCFKTLSADIFIFRNLTTVNSAAVAQRGRAADPFGAEAVKRHAETSWSPVRVGPAAPHLFNFRRCVKMQKCQIFHILYNDVNCKKYGYEDAEGTK